MAGVDLSTRDCGGQVVALRGQLDIAEAARGRQIIVDPLAGLEFIDSSGLAALVRGRNLARQAGVTCCSPRRSSRCCGSLPSPG